MKNIQVIDGALDCVYDDFAATDEEFTVIFTQGQDIVFIDEVRASGETAVLDEVLRNIWQRGLPRST